MTPEQPNIILVVMDTARADAFEPYGAPVGSSPAVAQMAGRGHAYQAFSSACWTVPAHASMFSGLSFRAAGFGEPASDHADYKAAGDRLADRWLPGVLGDHGYDTAGVSTNMWVSDWGGFDRGFEKWVQVTSSRALHGPSQSFRHRLAWAGQALRARTDDGASEVEATLGRWLADRSAGTPFFWFVNLVECHSPYLPPKPYNPLSALGRVRSGEEALRHLNFDAIWRGLCSRTEAPESALARMRELYAAAIRLMDDWVSRLHQMLDTAGILDETIVVITSDHGENLGEQGLLGHGFSLDDRLIRVPLVVSGPAAKLPQPVTSLCDIPAWLAASAGVTGHPWEMGNGKVAVAEFDSPVSPEDPRADEAIKAWRLGEEARLRLTTSFACATDGRLKLLRGNGQETLIDLGSDPLEREPIDVGAETEQRWADRLADLRAALDRAAAAEVPGVTATAPVAAGADELADMESQMRLLGYL